MEETSSDKKSKKNKCDICKLKYGLIRFECKCSGKFCVIHRYPESHNCKFD